jgi:hypothetical protein
MNNRDMVLDFLTSIAPKDATNSEIVARTGVKPHQQVFMITRELMLLGKIKGVQSGHEWRFWYGGSSDVARCDSALPRLSPQSEDEPYPWDRSNRIVRAVAMSWLPIGRIVIARGRLCFPNAPASPGLYRFHVREPMETQSAIYIGESENLSRRFSLYASSGPTQQTNLRLNKEFRESLAMGKEIAVAIVTEGAWLEPGGNEMTADFSIKVVRCVFENAAIVTESVNGFRSLNL